VHPILNPHNDPTQATAAAEWRKERRVSGSTWSAGLCVYCPPNTPFLQNACSFKWNLSSFDLFL